MNKSACNYSRLKLTFNCSLDAGNFPDIALSGVRADGSKSCGFKIPMAWLSGYAAMFAGMGITILVQSSSITTSALTPLVGVGVIKLERMYPTVLGANIGTTVTGVLAALAADGSALANTLSVAYAHLFFNLSGIVVWYTLWFLRPVPIALARGLGNTTARYRWFPLAYLAFAFFIIPTVFVILSVSSMVATTVVFVILVVGTLFVAVVNFLQDNKPHMLPGFLETWNFLPLCLRSLEPYDRMFCARMTCCSKKDEVVPEEAEHKEDVELGKLANAPKASDLEIATARLNVDM